jgi:hypothetical protein
MRESPYQMLNQQLRDVALGGDGATLRTLFVKYPQLRFEASGQIIIYTLEADQYECAMILASELVPTQFELSALGMLPRLRALIRHQTHKINTTDSDGCSMLHRASQFNRSGVVQYLLELGADTQLRDRSGRSALHIAAMFGQHQSISLLLDASDRHLEDHRGKTPLDLAIEHDQLESIQMLVEGQ